MKIWPWIALLFGFSLQALLCQDDCSNHNIITLQEDYGHISTDSIPNVSGSSCQFWRIFGRSNDTIVVRLYNTSLNKETCAAGSGLLLGPLPLLDVCKRIGERLPLMYHSENNIVWIKYTAGPQEWSTSQRPTFALEYILSSSPNCTFQCEDKTCIHKLWECNGQNECSKGEDEWICSVRATAKPVDQPPVAVIEPKFGVILRYPTTSCVLYGNYSTDDYGIVGYEWRKLGSSGLSSAMIGSYKSILYLSSLEVGEYMFSLTVTDTVKQQSTVSVKVIVRPASEQTAATGLQPKTAKLQTVTTSLKPLYKGSVCGEGEIYCYVLSKMSLTCLSEEYVCNGRYDCLTGEDESSSACKNTYDSITEKRNNRVCEYNEIYCYVAEAQRYACLPNVKICDGTADCYQSEDEDPNMCGNRACNRRLEDLTGWFSSLNFPYSYSYSKSTHCSWVIHQLGSSADSVIQLRVVVFRYETESNTDYIEVYDGPDSTYRRVGIYYAGKPPPSIIESTSNWMNVVFRSEGGPLQLIFNFTHQIKGVCLSSQRHCVGENDCYSLEKDRCNAKWDCPLRGADEVGCDHCDDTYWCGPDTNQCYHLSERCNGLARCSNHQDEANCSSVECGSHNGTFLCNNGRCIYESWMCDQRDDCGDNSDESFCAVSGTSKRVIIAAICGSMICALLLVILIGCSCKLYYLRHIDPYHHVHHETPMSRLYAEFLRRRAPPPYHEAMLTSRNFDEVQREYLEQIRNSHQNRRSRGNRRRSRNNQVQPQDDAVSDAQTQSAVVDEGRTVASGDSDSLQLHALRDENQNTPPYDHNSDNNQLDDESDTDSADESETDLGDEGQGQSEDQHGCAEHNNDSDDENILVASPDHWSARIDENDSSDDRCILADESHETINPSNNTPKIESDDNPAVISETDADSLSVENVLEVEVDEESVSDILEANDASPKQDANHNTAVINGANRRPIGRSNSRGSLESADYETCSESDVPLLVGSSV